MKKIVFLVISTLIMARLGMSLFDGYMVTHDYYGEMLRGMRNWNVLFIGLIGSLIPVYYIVFSKKITPGRTFLSILAGLYIYSLLFIGQSGNLFGLGFLKLLINCFLILGMGLGLISILTVLGGVAKKRFLSLNTEGINDLGINFGLGLSLFLLLGYILLFANIYFPLVNRIIVAGGLYGVYYYRETGKEYRKIITSLLSKIQKDSFHKSWLLLFSIPLCLRGLLGLIRGGGSASLFLGAIGLLITGIYLYGGFTNGNWRHKHTERNVWRIVICILLAVTFRYLFNGFMLAYMPYSTAWDANHAYMFTPKMRAFNNGLYWNEIAMSGVPYLWSTFISFWFSLFRPFGGLLGISVDTIAIEMNFFSGIYVLILGVILIKTVLDYIKKILGGLSKTKFHIGLTVGRLLLLLWLTSGMGAFLVFVDNKTDLGVLTFIVLAIFSGFMFLNQIDSYKEISKKAWKYIGVSGFFYGMAVLAKPTALFDVLNFGLFLGRIWFGVLLALGLFLIVIALLTGMEFRGIKDYLPPRLAYWIAGVGGVSSVVGLATRRMKQGWNKLRIMLVWGAAIIVTVAVFKVPFAIVDTAVYKRNHTIKSFVEKVFLTHAGENKKRDPLTSLYAQSVSSVASKNQCSLATQGFSSVDELYTDLEKTVGNSYNEDVGRYVGFGRKGNKADQRRGIAPFVNPIWALGFEDGCYGFNPLGLSTRNGRLLCDAFESWSKFDKESLSKLQSSLSNESKEKEYIDAFLEAIKQNPTTSTAELVSTQSQNIQELTALMQNNTMKVETIEGVQFVYLPYRFLNFLNMTYNWSLQNESSYYTDIGVVRLILLVFSIISMLYGIISGKRVLAALSGVTLFGWIIWLFVGGGILWYGIGLIIWSIASFVVYLVMIFEDDHDIGQGVPSVLSYIFVGIFLLVGVRQLGLNMIRISSHSLRAGGVFMQYRTNRGLKSVINEKMETTKKLTGTFSKADVFKSQFAHYNDLIKVANEREEDDGVRIAGTYSRYFINDQKFVKYDQFVEWMYKMVSDGDVCNSYLRLKDQHIRYIAIDPNIGTVVQGDANKSLFYRFYGKLNTSTAQIEEDGAITMFTKMRDAGYLRLVTTSNLGAKYAFTLPEETYKNIAEKDRIVFKSRMAVGRYFGKRGENQFVKTAIDIAEQRVKDGKFVTDIADVLGLDVRDSVLLGIIAKGNVTEEDIQDLTQDERGAISQFLYLRYLNQQQPEEYTKTLRGFVENSIYSPNQIIVFELVE